MLDSVKDTQTKLQVGEIMQKNIDYCSERSANSGRLTVVFVIMVILSLIPDSVVTQHIRIDVRSDKKEYYSDEKLFVLVRVENSSTDTVQISTGKLRGHDNELGSVLCIDTESAAEYRIVHPDWRNLSFRVAPGSIELSLIVLRLYRIGGRNEPVIVPLHPGEYTVKYEFIVTVPNKEITEYVVQGHINILSAQSEHDRVHNSQYWRSKFRTEKPDQWRDELKKLLTMHSNAPYRNTIIYIYSQLLLYNQKYKRSYPNVDDRESPAIAGSIIMNWVLEHPYDFAAIICLEELKNYHNIRLMLCAELLANIALTNEVVSDYLLHSYCR